LIVSLLPVVVLPLCCAVVCAQIGPTGKVTTITGRSVAGALTVDAAGEARVTGSGDPAVIQLEEIASFAADGVEGEPVSAPHRIWMRSGLEYAASKLHGVPAAAGKPARIAAELPLGVTIELPVSAIRALRQGGSGREQPATFESDLLSPADNTDMLWVEKDGKLHRFQVTVSGVENDKIEFDLRDKAHDYALDGVVAIVFGSNTGFAVDRQQPPRIAVDFDSGCHLEGRLLGLGKDLSLRLDEGSEVSVPSSRIIRMTVASDRLRWLSDLTPQVEQTPAFDRQWPWTVDRSIAGPGFVLGGQVWTRGIGMVPRTRLTYDLGGKYDVFQATIGIDDRGGPQAHAVFRVYVDGGVVFESEPHTRGRPPQPLRVALNKCQQLAIEVDFGKNYDLGDYCAFANACVIRQ